MNKKITVSLLTLLTSISLVSLGGCKKNDFAGKVYLDYGYIHENPVTNITELPELTYNKLKSRITIKESFMLVLYNHSCSCWNDFQPVITRYINETNVDVQYIDVDEFTGETELFGLFLEKINMPSVALFKRGKLVKQAINGNDAASLMFENYEKFKQWSDENVVLPKLLYLDRTVLDNYIAENRTFNLYVAKKECPDCQAITYDILNDYIDNNVEFTNPLYIFDIEKYQGTSEYQNIKNQYGLNKTEVNPVLGYELYGGAVPTFQHREGSEIKDMITVLNDYASDGKVHSYFTQERVAAMDFLKNCNLVAVLDNMDVTGEWSTYKKEFYKNYHYPIAKEFFNTYLF